MNYYKIYKTKNIKSMPVTRVLFAFSHTIILRTLKRTPIYILETEHFVFLNQHNNR